LCAAGLALAALVGAIKPGLASIYVGGDSLGVGVGMASRAPSVAKESVRISFDKKKLAIGQIERVPVGSTLFLSLGTNDAVGGVTAVQDGVSAIVSAAQARSIRLVWLGPPCVFKTWDTSAKALDGVLASVLAADGITYVSMRDDALCVRSLRAGDGVHFTMRGYRMMWDRAIAASGETDTSPPLAPDAASSRSARLAALAAQPPVPMPEPAFRLGLLTYGQVFPAPLPAFRRPTA
jgi:hypothetical protein